MSGTDATSQDAVIAPDLAALGLTHASVSEAGNDPGSYSPFELLLYVVDPAMVTDLDPAAVVLDHAAAWLDLLTTAVHDGDPLLLDLDARLNDLRREIEVGVELHRRQRVALLEALAAARGEP